MMYKITYNFTVSLTAFLLPVIGVFSPKVKQFISTRAQANTPSKTDVKYWIHCASLGEYEMAVSLINELLKTHSLDDILITFFSPSGYEHIKNKPYASRSMYLPLDTLKNVKAFYNNYNPAKALFIRYDFWYNFIQYGQKNNTQFYLINGRFQPDHFIFSRYGRPYLKLIQKFENLFTSDKTSCKLLEEYNKHTHFVGDTRYDRVANTLETAREFADIVKFKSHKKLLIVGSSWEKEEALTKKLLDTSPDNLCVIIAPHDIQRTDQIIKEFKLYSPKRYTNADFDEETSIVVLDTIGMLSELYRYADFSLIGGGFHGALHNIIEPAVWGSHISFGPNYHKFPEAYDAIDHGFGFALTNENQWIEMIHNLLKEDHKLQEIKKVSSDYVITQQKATEKIAGYILNQA